MDRRRDGDRDRLRRPLAARAAAAARLLLAAGVALVAFAGAAAEPELLEPEQAFRFAARVRDARMIEVTYQIAPGYYLYRDKFRFELRSAGARLGAAQLPPGRRHRDEFFGEVETYRGALTILLPFEWSGAAPVEATLIAVSQGCADVGVCYVPQEQKARLLLAAAGAPPARDAAAPAGAAVTESDDARYAALIGGGFWLAVVSFFGLGLLLAFTPCVLPMVPILSGIIIGSGSVSRARGLTLAGLYVLGMAVVYAAAGVAAGLSGEMLAATLQNPWVVGAFAAIFVALALAMFDFYELQIPATWQSRLAAASNRVHGGHAFGVLLMGGLSALIVGPCVAAPLAGALLYISQSRDVLLGGSALFAMALGMGTPLLAVGASAGALLPRAGPWMQTIKRFFGTMLLAVAIYLVSPYLPTPVQMFLWGALLVMSAAYLRAIDPLPPDAAGFERFCKGLGLIALAAGLAYLIGAFAGSRDLLQPLAGLRAGAQATESGGIPFERVRTLAELEARVRTAGRPVMLDFYADWCVSCKEMERFTFSDERVKARFGEMLLLQADVTAHTAEGAALLRRFRLFGPPGIVFFDRDGREIPGLRVIGFQSADRFVKVLDEALGSR